MTQASIAFIGAGNMAGSLIGGLISEGYSATQLRASDPFEPSRQRLQQDYGIACGDDNPALARDADILVLAVKPQVMKDVCASLQTTLAQRASAPLIISIAAGIEIASLEKWLGGALPVVRCMPNTPALLRCGATALYANDRVSAAQRAQADAILRAVGSALWVECEAELDAVTALSGSGPAYFFLVMEAMQAAGEQLGLSAEVARQLTLQTALGASRMAVDSDVDAAELRRRVTSPGGTTERAVQTFESAGLRELFVRALTAARDRSQELARMFDQ